MCYAAGSHEGKTCGEFHWVDMEQKLGLVPPAAVAAITGTGIGIGIETRTGTATAAATLPSASLLSGPITVLPPTASNQEQLRWSKDVEKGEGKDPPPLENENKVGGVKIEGKEDRVEFQSTSELDLEDELREDPALLDLPMDDDFSDQEEGRQEQTRDVVAVEGQQQTKKEEQQQQEEEPWPTEGRETTIKQ